MNRRLAPGRVVVSDEISIRFRWDGLPKLNRSVAGPLGTRMVMGSLVRLSRLAYLTYFSQPASDRIIYRLIRKHRVRRILELGIGTGRRTIRMLEAVDRGTAIGSSCSTGQVSYTGIDLFEMRLPAHPSGLSLKLAHRQLRATGA